MLEPRKAVVLVRRRQTESDPERHRRLAVAAAFPSGLLETGTEIAIGRGEIGYAAETMNLMDRRDFDHEFPLTRNRLRDETPQTLRFDVVAPMVINEEVVGVIAVEGIKRTSPEGKDLLRLLAQLGAASMHAKAQYSEMKATASLDGLTGIYNKRFLTERLADEILRAVDRSSPLSVFIFDLDNFKHYNDRNGHVAGHQLLQSLTRLVPRRHRAGPMPSSRSWMRTLLTRGDGVDVIVDLERGEALRLADADERVVGIVEVAAFGERHNHEHIGRSDHPLGERQHIRSERGHGHLVAETRPTVQDLELVQRHPPAGEGREALAVAGMRQQLRTSLRRSSASPQATSPRRRARSNVSSRHDPPMEILSGALLPEKTKIALSV
jgi:GGDEF domain-containing protein